MENKIKVGVTIGDINGIGIEIILKTFINPDILDICTPIIYGSSRVVSYHRKAIGIADFSFNIISSADRFNPKRPNLINCWNEDVKIELGKPTPIAGQYAMKSLDFALEDLKNKKIDVLVTAPVNKHTVQPDARDGVQFRGHTEYIARKFNQAGNELMLMVGEKFKIGIITGHIPLKKVPETITPEIIARNIKILNRTLIQDFSIIKPRIAILGLNPHSGDEGLLGNEEDNIIKPVIQKAKDANYLIFGPYSADGFFGSLSYTRFDAVLAMYHDQGLIPFKVLSFEDGVNFTAGLSCIRTSPAHGTAYEISGKNLANEASFRKAIYLACDIYRNRQRYNEMSANPLKNAGQK